MNYTTTQEEFWAGEFGFDYIERNNVSSEYTASYLAMWNKMIPYLSQTPRSILEFGTNIGLNLRALKVLLPKTALSGVEINSKAVEILNNWGGAKIYNESILNFAATEKYDLVFTSGVLIHINPEKLPLVYKKMYDNSSRYIIISEYYNPTPVEVEYRGHLKKLFKRDFAKELMTLYPDLSLRGYGFAYHGDPNFAFGDFTWFVMEKLG